MKRESTRKFQDHLKIKGFVLFNILLCVRVFSTALRSQIYINCEHVFFLRVAGAFFTRPDADAKNTRKIALPLIIARRAAYSSKRITLAGRRPASKLGIRRVGKLVLLLPSTRKLLD